MLRTILVPLDGSRCAEHALPVATRLARGAKGSLLLVRVIEFADIVCQTTELATRDLVELSKRARRSAKAYLNRIAAQEDVHDLPCSTRVVEGSPAQNILKLVQELHADIVVMNSHGFTGIKQWTLGSVAHQVARHNSTPTLIVRENEPLPPLLMKREPAAEERLRILVALDGSSQAEEALVPAIQLSLALSAPGKAALHLLTVVPVSLPGVIFAQNIQSKKKEALTTLAAKLEAQGASEYDLQVTTSVVQHTDIAAALITYAREHVAQPDGCQLIAMTTQGAWGWFMGSVAERVLNHTPLPLLMVRPLHTPTQQERPDSRSLSIY
ncbi:universal stress protein UspA [Ktedonobacter sp. SOSP1-85]|uniref:universal stress protein n=1 Tax=Ktedonobacter sp. SOSP1-85 TaxID=2778367 RepID=UPI001916A623|nr:universal stress protein [Ktedonobacter sp. SOSP1-85]GHO80165.1 universal stress protein UspA [Ktedonobacter sp. SOSP1-85]